MQKRGEYVGDKYLCMYICTASSDAKGGVVDLPKADDGVEHDVDRRGEAAHVLERCAPGLRAEHVHGAGVVTLGREVLVQGGREETGAERGGEGRGREDRVGLPRGRQLDYRVHTYAILGCNDFQSQYNNRFDQTSTEPISSKRTGSQMFQYVFLPVIEVFQINAFPPSVPIPGFSNKM